VRWKVALGIAIEDHPFAKSTLQLFRAQLVTNGGAQRVFKKSLVLAKEQGFLKQDGAAAGAAPARALPLPRRPRRGDMTRSWGWGGRGGSGGTPVGGVDDTVDDASSSLLAARLDPHHD